MTADLMTKLEKYFLFEVETITNQFKKPFSLVPLPKAKELGLARLIGVCRFICLQDPSLEKELQNKFKIWKEQIQSL